MDKTKTTECMIVQKRCKTPGEPPVLNVVDKDGQNKEITSKKSCRILGANVQNSITWQEHLETGREVIVATSQKEPGHVEITR